MSGINKGELDQLKAKAETEARADPRGPGKPVTCNIYIDDDPSEPWETRQRACYKMNGYLQKKGCGYTR
jgi:hypothetical protein